MNQDRDKLKLSAILSAGVVGYSRLRRLYHGVCITLNNDQKLFISISNMAFIIFF